VCTLAEGRDAEGGGAVGFHRGFANRGAAVDEDDRAGRVGAFDLRGQRHRPAARGRIRACREFDRGGGLGDPERLFGFAAELGDGFVQGRATYQTGGLYAQGLAVGDFENDGRVDVAVINSGSANVTIMSNNGTGEFNLTSTIGINGNPTSIAAADFNGDGILDLAIVDDQNGLVDVAYGDVSGGFLAPVGSPVGQYAEKIAVGDFNGDGNPDVAVSDYGADDVAVLLNLGGNESFAAPTFYPVGHLPTGIAVGDLNGDGNADIAVTNQGDRVLSILEGDGDGAFGAQVAVPTPVSPSSVAIGDLTGSGENDMVVLNESGNAAYTYLAGTASTLTVQTGSPSYTVEEEVSATTTLAGAGSPSGTLTFSLFGPGDEACERYPVYTKEVAASGPGTYEATSYGIYEDGAYHWVVEYSGNATNSPVANSCADPEAELVVLKGAPIITSEASGSVGLGDHISDVATLSGGSAYPQGTITFNVYGPDDATCSSAPAFTYEEEAYGDGAYYSSEFTPTEPGTYRFVGEYSGDRSNEPDANGCTDPQASVLVNNAAPSIFTESSGDIGLGESTSDTAHLIDGSSPTGTITFRLYGPGAMNCGERLVFTSAPVTVSGEGEYSSESFTPTESGYYFWVAEYSGDRLEVAFADPDQDLQGFAFAGHGEVRDAVAVEVGDRDTGRTRDVVAHGRAEGPVTLADRDRHGVFPPVGDHEVGDAVPVDVLDRLGFGTAFGFELARFAEGDRGSGRGADPDRQEDDHGSERQGEEAQGTATAGHSVGSPVGQGGARWGAHRVLPSGRFLRGHGRCRPLRPMS
jgi:FG-GAP-like repeat